MELGARQEHSTSQAGLEGSCSEDGQEKFLCCGDAVSWTKAQQKDSVN